MLDSFDADLVAARKNLRQQIEASLLTDERFLGAFYGGSIAENQEDAYSDIDLRLLVSQETFAQFNQFKVGLVNQWGTVLFLENQLSKHLIIAHYDCFVKVDVFCYTMESLLPSTWTKQLLIIKDTPDQLLVQLEVKSAKKKQELSMDEWLNWQTKFLAYYHEVFRRAQRNEQYYASDCVDKMRQLVVMGWHYQDGLVPNSFGDWAKCQGVRSKLTKRQQDQLAYFFVDQDLSCLGDVMSKISTAFLSICERIENEQTLPYSQQTCLAIIQMVEFSQQADP